MDQRAPRIELGSPAERATARIARGEPAPDEVDIARTAPHADLERRLRERTAELESANHALVAYVYAVSHELRTPLHALDGFAKLLDEEYHDRLDPCAIHYLERIRSGAQRIGRILEDTRKLAALVQPVLRHAPVDVSALAHDVVRQLMQAEPGRNIQVRIAPGLTVGGDGRLLRMAFDQLIGNAWKFTRHRKPALIEVDRLPGTGPPTFYIRDNGDGFDMKHADRLFTLFGRLHTLHEFEGNGVGLAIVQRIVLRHGGRVWAHGEPGQGATFYIHLPETPLPDAVRIADPGT